MLRFPEHVLPSHDKPNLWFFYNFIFTSLCIAQLLQQRNNSKSQALKKNEFKCFEL